MRLRDVFSGLVLCVVAFGSFARPVVGQCGFEWKQVGRIPGVVGIVYCSTLWDPDGAGPQPEMYVIGGSFTDVGGVACKNLAAWDGERWRSLDVPATTSLASVAVNNGELYAAGERIWRLGEDLTWEVIGDPVTTSPGRVNAIQGFGGDLIVTGRFFRIRYPDSGEVSAYSPYFARWDGVAWNAMPSSITVTGQIEGGLLCEHGGELYAMYDPIGSHGYSACVRWDGASWVGFAGPQFPAKRIESFGGSLYVCGVTSARRFDGTSWVPLASFTPTFYFLSTAQYNGKLYFGGYLSSSLCLYAWNGSALQAIFPTGSQISQAITELKVYDNKLIALGPEIRNSLDQARDTFMQFDGNSWEPMMDGLDAPPTAMTSFEGDLVVTGDYYPSPYPYNRQPVIRFHDGKWGPLGNVSWNSTSGFYGSSLAVFRGDLIAGGGFYDDGNLSRIARWDGLAWQPLQQGLPSIVRALLVSSDELIVGGNFLTSNDGVTLNYVGRWDGEHWSPLGSGFSSIVYALAEWNGQIIAASFLNGVRGVYRWNGESWEALGGTFNNTIRALAVHNSELFASGDFTTVDGVTVNRVARWNGVSWVPLASGLSGPVHAIRSYNGNLYASGKFNVFPGSNRTQVGRWDGAAWQEVGGGLIGRSGSLTAADGTSFALHVHNDQLFVGGEFMKAVESSVLSPYVVAWGPTCERGDMDCDGTVDLDDAPLFVNALLADGPLAACESYTANVNADVYDNGTGRVDGADVGAFAELLVGVP